MEEEFSVEPEEVEPGILMVGCPHPDCDYHCISHSYVGVMDTLVSHMNDAHTTRH